MKSSEQKFLNDLDKKLWNAADRLRSSLDAAVYKHAVLGLIFLKYVSDSFDTRRQELKAQFQDPEHDYYLDPEEFDSDTEYQEGLESELEVRDYYTEKNVFWVPARSRWKTLQNLAALPPGAELPWMNGNGQPARMKSLGRLIDDALEAIEKENPKLKGVLNRNYASLQLEQDKLLALINDVIGTIPFEHESLHAKDIL
ncbi:MAG: SAM-dependent DNA methyltransferase, partial [Magnetococcales bacterium]|nr:SAM-dependent DNA methyltransferase [Magnetococcales bacterium]